MEYDKIKKIIIIFILFDITVHVIDFDIKLVY